MNTIYCIEDDDHIRELILYTLEMTGFKARGFAGSGPFWEGLRSIPPEKPDLLLLDVMLPGENGFSILQRMKRSADTETIPVIMLTAKSDEFDIVTALDQGADDYLTKPFGMMELVSRIRAVLRRCSRTLAVPPALELHGIRIDERRHVVTVEGEVVVLTLKEYELLKLLLSNPETVMTRDQLLNQLWGYGYSGESRTLDVHMATLRQKLGKAGELIETVRGVGYRMRAEQ